jgi:hypothetical protein
VNERNAFDARVARRNFALLSIGATIAVALIVAITIVLI